MPSVTQIEIIINGKLSTGQTLHAPLYMKNLNDLFTLLENKNLLLLEHMSVTFSKQQ